MAGKRHQGRPRDPTFQQLVDLDLRERQYKPVYILVGEDTLRIESVVESLRNGLLGKEGSAFNYHVFHGEQAVVGDVLAQALSYPMLGGNQVIWLRNAEDNTVDKAAETALVKYLQDPVQATCMIVSALKVDGRRKWVKAARDKGYLFDFSPPKGYSLMEWVRKATRKAGLKLDNSLLEVLIDLVGEDLHALSAELEKLALLAEEREEPLTAEMLAEIVMAQGEVGKFELVDNLQPGNPGPALKIWFTQAAWGARAEEVAPILLWRIRKIALLAALMKDKIPDGDLPSLAGLHPWVCNRLKESIRHLKPQGVARGLQASYRCDRSLKRHSLRPEIALERAILEICGGP